MLSVSFVKKSDCYSESAMQSLINGAPGKPFYAEDGKTIIGEVLKAEQVEGSTNIRYDVGIYTLG